MWYVLDAARDAKLVYGFYHDISREMLKKSLETGTVEKYLQKIKVQKDDLFYIEAGTVHAIMTVLISPTGCMITTGLTKTAGPESCT